MKSVVEGCIMDVMVLQGEVILSVASHTVAISILMTPEEVRRLSSRLFQIYVECLSGGRKEGLDS